jgi:hypothetical protein
MDDQARQSSTTENDAASVDVATDVSLLLRDPQNPVVARLLAEVADGRRSTSGYDRAHNRHNRS